MTLEEGTGREITNHGTQHLLPRHLKRAAREGARGRGGFQGRCAGAQRTVTARADGAPATRQALPRVLCFAASLKPQTTVFAERGQVLC